MTPTFLLRPRRSHNKGHHQVQRSQEACGCAPWAPAAAGRGLQTGPGGRGGGGGGGSSCSSRPLPHPCRPGTAALEIRRGSSRRGGGAGAVVRAQAAAPGESAVRGPGLGLRAWVWVRACVSARVSVTAAASASPARSQSREAAGQARQAAILETGTGHWRWPARGGAQPWAPPLLCVTCGRTPQLSALDARGPNPSSRFGGPQPVKPGGGSKNSTRHRFPAGRRKEAAPTGRQDL